MRLFKKMFAVILTSVTVLCGIQAPQKASAETEKKEKRIIVSLGDSFSSGEGIEPFWGQDDILQKLIEDEEKDKKDIHDWFAHRSKLCWSGQLVLDGLKMSEHRDDNWYFAASSGAVINDLYYEQNKDYNLDKRYRKEYGIDKIKQKLLVFHFPKKAEQIIDDIIAGKIHDVALLDDSDYEALKKYGRAKNNLKGNKKLEPQLDIFETVGKGNTDYVTLTIGGNDAHFTDVVIAATRIGCFAAKGEEHSIVNPNALKDSLDDNWNHFNENGGIKDSLYKAYEDIQDKAGEQAKIIVAGYPKLLNSSLNPKFKFIIVMPDGSSLFFPVLNNVIINDSVSKFNDEIEKIVDDCRENKGLNTFFVSVEGDKYFGGHEAYTDEEYINGIIIPLKSEDLDQSALPPVSAYSIHPNEEGAKAYASAVQNKIDELEENGIISGFIYANDKKTIDKDILSKVKYISAMDIKSGKRSYGKIVNYETGYYEIYVNTVHPNKIEIQLQDGTSFWIQQCEPSEDEDNLAQITVNKREFLRNIDIDFKGQCLLSDSSDFEWYLEPSVEADNIIVSDLDECNFDSSLVAEYTAGFDPGDYSVFTYSILEKDGKYSFIDYEGKSTYGDVYGDIYLNIDGKMNLVNSDDFFGFPGSPQFGYFMVPTNTHIIDYFSNEFYSGEKTVMVEYMEGAEPYKVGAVNDGISTEAFEEGRMNYFSSNGITAFKKHGKWGYFDNNCNQIIDFQCETFNDTMTDVLTLDGVDWNNDNNNVFMASSGYIPVKKDGKCGYYDTAGNEVIPVGTFEDVRPVHKGKARVKDKKTGLWGVISLPRTWQEVYKDKLNEYYNSEYYNDCSVGVDTEPGSMFDLYDVDENGIPELFISQGNFGGAEVYVYTVIDNQSYELLHIGRNGEIMVNKDNSYIMGYYDHMGYQTNFIYHMEGAKCDKIIKLEHNNIDSIYSVDDTAVSEEVYEQNLHKYVDDIDWIVCGRKYSFNQINEDLNDLWSKRP